MKKTRATVKKASSKRLKSKAPSKKRLTTVRDTAKDEIDGCDVAVTSATLDHELPPSQGGVS